MPSSVKAGVSTYWTSYGQGPRRALMIHCSLAHCGSWGRLAGGLSGALTMTAFDLPGHGRSADWDGQQEIQGLSTRIAAAFLDGPADVIGHSFGATVALRLAVERPALVRSLVLIEPVFFAVARQDWPGPGAAPGAHPAAFDAAMAAGDRRRAAREFTRVWGDGTPWDALPEAQKRMMAERVHLVEAGSDALFHDVGGMLAPGVLEALRAPALLIEGSASPPVIAAINDGLAARLPRVARTVIMGAGHMVPMTHAAQLAPEILRFLETA